MKHGFVSQHTCSMKYNTAARANGSGRAAAAALTKEAFWILVLLSSLGLWAAIWAGAGSLASAWLQ